MNLLTARCKWKLKDSPSKKRGEEATAAIQEGIQPGRKAIEWLRNRELIEELRIVLAQEVEQVDDGPERGFARGGEEVEQNGNENNV